MNTRKKNYFSAAAKKKINETFFRKKYTKKI